MATGIDHCRARPAASVVARENVPSAYGPRREAAKDICPLTGFKDTFRGELLRRHLQFVCNEVSGSAGRSCDSLDILASLLPYSCADLAVPRGPFSTRASW
jgi:hypothetical protein